MFAATGRRDETLFWRDVTAQMVKDFTRRPDNEGEIGSDRRTVRPELLPRPAAVHSK
jgi:hypothetical protein